MIGSNSIIKKMKIGRSWQTLNLQNLKFANIQIKVDIQKNPHKNDIEQI